MLQPHNLLDLPSACSSEDFACEGWEQKGANGLQ